MTPGQLAAIFGKLAVVECMTEALERQAERLKSAVQASLDDSPGGPHDQPWRLTGALRDSICASVDELTARVGSNDPAAAAQEFGTVYDPPRPFLGPAVNALAEPIAGEIGLALMRSMSGLVN